jgi:mono/diheme cytochrome c family protein
MRAALIALAVLVIASGAAVAQLDDPAHFQLQDGGALYRDICQGCHMSNGKGASGAGAYPALTADRKLAAAGYPVLVVLHGQKAMPGFAGMLSDAQVAAVVNYVRTHFGNHYRDAVSAGDVQTARQ